MHNQIVKESYSMIPLSSHLDDLFSILILIVASIIICGILTVILYWNKYHYNIKIQELETKYEKLKRYASNQKRRILRDAITMLNPEEKAHLFSIWEDNSIISRKALFKLNELEDRLKRAERGTELKWAENKIRKLKRTEGIIFKDQFERKQ